MSTGTIYDPGTAVHETYNTSAAGDPKALTPSVTVTDGNGGNNYSYNLLGAEHGPDRPGPANLADVHGATQVDTKTNTPIYNVCAPSGR